MSSKYHIYIIFTPPSSLQPLLCLMFAFKPMTYSSLLLLHVHTHPNTHTHTHKYKLLSLLSAGCMYMCLGLTIWDCIIHQGACPWWTLILPPSITINRV